MLHVDSSKNHIYKNMKWLTPYHCTNKNLNFIYAISLLKIKSLFLDIIGILDITKIYFHYQEN